MAEPVNPFPPLTPPSPLLRGEGIKTAAPPEGRGRDRYPELLLDLADQAQHHLVQHGIDATVAEKISWELAEHIRHAWGGVMNYIPKGMLYEITQQHRQIWAEFAGDNHQALALKHDMSVQHVYRIVKRVGDEERRKRQVVLFPEA